MNLPPVVLSTTKLKGNFFTIRVVMTFIAITSIYEALNKGQILSISHVLTHIYKTKPSLSLVTDEATVTE